MFRTSFVIGGAVACALSAAPALALDFDQDVTPDILFGDGNANGAFTTDTGVAGLEIGLRAKLRFDSNNQPQNIFNSNGDGTYTFAPGNPPTGFGFDPNNPTTPIWNFEWSVNTDTTGSTGATVGNYTYEMGLDADPSAGTNFLTFDPITAGAAAPFWDHAFGTNATANGDGVSAGDLATYNTLLATDNVAQNSWSYEFFNNGAPLSSFDPNDAGEYQIYLAVFDNGTEIGRSTITVIVTPAPGGIAAFGLGALGVARRRRR